MWAKVGKGGKWGEVEGGGGGGHSGQRQVEAGAGRQRVNDTGA